MKTRVIIFSFGSLVLLLAILHNGALPAAAQPQLGDLVEPTSMSDPTWVAVAPSSAPAVRARDSYPRLAPSAPCEVSGIIDTDTTWSPSECDPYVVTGNLSVQPGATLTIQPGTTVKFDRLKALAVAGTLVACGTEANRITFTSNQSSPAKGDWSYIRFADSSVDASPDRDCNGNGSGSIIQYATIEYAGGTSESHNGALLIKSSSPFIDNSIIRDNDSDGIHFWEHNAAPHITNNTIIDNSGAGIHVGYWSGGATISGNTITGNSYRGIYVDESATITGNTITGNSAAYAGGGIYVDNAATITGNTITGNSASVGGGIYVAYGGAPTISGNTIASNTASATNQGGGIWLDNGTHPTINDNNLYGNVTGSSPNTPNDLYNGNEYGSDDVNAENNYWGTTDREIIEDHIWHFMDDPSLGSVDFIPFRLQPVGTSTPVTDVTISGPTTGTVGTPYTFTTTASPPTATQPITYVWQATGQSPVTHVDGPSVTHSFAWAAPGTHAITVTASNAWGSASAGHTIAISPPGTDGDAYEPDDVCAQASALSTDGAAQPHTFHDHADEDWTYFTVTSGITYVFQATSTSPGADLVLELYDACDGNLEGSDDALGNDAHVIFSAPASGTYYVKALNHDPDTCGPDVTYELSVRAQSQAGVVIIVAGRKYNPEPLQANINYVANQAFRVFKNGGIPPEDIYYLHHDATQDADDDGSPDVDDAATAAALEHAITTWATSRTGPETPLYLYFADHGMNDLFLIDGYGDVITPTQLDGWLTTLESATGCPVNVFIESCRSGSFITTPQEISKPGRVIVTSAASHQAAHAYPDGNGAYFSNHFLSLLGDNADLWTCYTRTHSFLESVPLGQIPWLDDNGDAVSDARDGAIARQRGLTLPPLGAIPWIASISAPAQIDGYTAAISADVYEDEPSPLVWAEIIAPSYEAPGSEDEMVYVDVPRVLLNDGDGDGTYTGAYGGFTEIGEYQVIVYARDSDGNQGLPKSTTVRTGWPVFLPLILR